MKVKTIVTVRGAAVLGKDGKTRVRVDAQGVSQFQLVCSEHDQIPDSGHRLRAVLDCQAGTTGGNFPSVCLRLDGAILSELCEVLPPITEEAI